LAGRPDTEVLIIGAGPVGLVTALRLAQQNIPFTLCEAEATLAADLRASTLHPPTLDMLATLGLAGELDAQGLRCPSWQVRMHETHEKAEFELALIAAHTHHPWRLQCEQFRLCHAAWERLRGQHDIRLGTRVVKLRPEADGVTAVLANADGELSLRADWVVGADGAHSLARRFVDREFAGHSYPETTILATTPFPFEEALPLLSNVNYVWWAGGTFSLLRLPTIWRCSLYPDPGESIEAALEPEAIQRKLQRIVPRTEAYEVRQLRPYRIHMRLAASYRLGRIVLAGDAAHLNSPSGGMGMNAGIHDAFALTAALAAIRRGASDSLLDEYSTSRRQVAAAEILSQADNNRARMQERDPDVRQQLFNELKATAADPERATSHLLRTSMITGLRNSAASWYEECL